MKQESLEEKLEKEKKLIQQNKKYRRVVSVTLTYFLIYIIMFEPFIKLYEKIDNYIGTILIIIVNLLVVDAYLNNIYKELRMINLNKKEVKKVEVKNKIIAVILSASLFFSYVFLTYYLGVVLRKTHLAVIDYVLFIQVMGVTMAITTYLLAIPVTKKIIKNIYTRAKNKKMILDSFKILGETIIKTVIIFTLLIFSVKGITYYLDLQNKINEIEKNTIENYL